MSSMPLKRALGDARSPRYFNVLRMARTRKLFLLQAQSQPYTADTPVDKSNRSLQTAHKHAD
jgi:hypothetical protein